MYYLQSNLKRLWAAAVDMEKDKRGRKTWRLTIYTWRTTSTALQLAIDHAFTDSYAKRFRPSDPPEMLACPSGAHLCTPQHIIRECRIFYQHRINHAIHTQGGTLPFKSLFTSVTFPD